MIYVSILRQIACGYVQGDCISFALSHPAVAHNISSIRTIAELEESTATLAAIDGLSEAEQAAKIEQWREYGTLVHGDQEGLVDSEYVEAIKETYAAGVEGWSFDNMGTEDDPTSGNAVLGEAHGEVAAGAEKPDAKL